MKFLVSKLVILVPALWAAVASAEVDKQAFQAIEQGWEAAFNKGDAAAVAKYYSEDAVLVPQDEDVTTGRKAIEALFVEHLKGLASVKLGTVDIESLAPDLVYKIGTFELLTKDQPPVKLAGKTGLVFRKIGNEWLIIRETYNYKPVK
jgi:uncharacterized protein (TIGR02246 family)